MNGTPCCATTRYRLNVYSPGHVAEMLSDCAGLLEAYLGHKVSVDQKLEHAESD